MKRSWWKINLIIIILLFQSIIITSVVPLSIKNHEGNKIIINHTNINYFNDWSVKRQDIINYRAGLGVFNRVDRKDTISEDDWNIDTTNDSKQGPMDSAWPMQGQNVHHTCLSPYSTENNPGAELWRVHGNSAGAVYGSAILDCDKIIYFGTKGSDSSLYALYQNGTVKWRFHSYGLIWGTPAIAENGDIYCTKWGDSYLRAVTKNGTLRWLFNQEASSASSSTIGPDGTIYFGTDGYKIFAVNPDGTEKWRYSTGYIVMGSPSVGVDGTIYIGSGDHYLYALYPNGTLRWRFNTGAEIKGSASIADDGTIYVPSFNGYFYALYPNNGTLKWRASTGGSIAAAGVAIAENGTLYVGTEQLRAYYPNGTLRWVTDVHGSIYGTIPAVSAEGTIYISAGGSLVAVNPDGTERWRKQLTIAQIHSSPSIGPDNHVYVGSEDYGLSPYGYLHAFGLGPLRAEAYGPYKGAMTQPLQFTGEAFGGTPPYTTYHWDFGDGNTSDEQNPTHIYAHRGNYTATFTVIDATGNHSSDTSEVTIGYPLPHISIIKPENAVYIFNIKILPWPYPLAIGRIMFQVEASQVEIGIDRVEFYYDGQLQHTDKTAPYQYLYTGHWPPLHQTFTIRCYDTRGNSNTITETINKWF